MKLVVRFKCVVLIVLASVCFSAKAQDYKTLLKLSAGTAYNASVKILTGFENGYEFTLGYNKEKYMMEALRVFQVPAFPEGNSKLFLSRGFGAHVSYNTQYCLHNFFFNRQPYMVKDKFFTVGIDGYIGMEYRMLSHPFVLSFDWRPCFEMFGPKHFEVNVYNVGVGIAYTIN